MFTNISLAVHQCIPTIFPLPLQVAVRPDPNSIHLDQTAFILLMCTNTHTYTQIGIPFSLNTCSLFYLTKTVLHRSNRIAVGFEYFNCFCSLFHSLLLSVILKKCSNSPFQTDLIYPNGCMIPAKQMDLLDAISPGSDGDRLFINSAFFIFFSAKKLRKQVKHGLQREAVLEKFRSSTKYGLMRAIYEYRVLSDGSGNIDTRIRLFRSTFRVKLNNWWRVNG